MNTGPYKLECNQLQDPQICQNDAKTAQIWKISKSSSFIIHAQ